MFLRITGKLKARGGSATHQTVRTAERYFILFMALSFLGWAAETVFFLFCYGEFHDRGFMTLPFCTIYGCSFLLLYGMIGSPRSSRNKVAYFLLCALIPTALELVTGWFFHRQFGLRLWSYESYRFQYHGYICLEYALLWGLLIPPCMTHIVLPLKRRIFAMSAAHTSALSLVLAAAAAVDWSINFARL